MKETLTKLACLFFAAAVVMLSATAIVAGAVDASGQAPQAAAQVQDEQPEQEEGNSPYEQQDPPLEPPAEPEQLKVQIESPSLNVNPRKTVELKAIITPAEQAADYKVLWSSNDVRIATVDKNGVVTGKSVGKAVITATLEGTEVSASFPIFVVRNNNAILDYFSGHDVVSYKYSYPDDYFYTDDRNCWQSAFGYRNMFDQVAPYVEIEIDYVRVHFDYDDLSWMVQLWKGQYGYLFYGSEVGVYTREKLAPDEEITVMTKYDRPDEENWLNMEMVLYWDERNNGEFVYQFTRPYDKYWWCTGFKPGSLRQSEPADELRMDSVIEFKSEEMARVFADKLIVCGFTEAENAQDIPLDSFHVDGKKVHVLWQDISEAESTVVVKATFWSVIIMFMLGNALLLALLGSTAFLGLFIFLI